ncbi:N-formylglutamate amidohydrolase [Nitratireductor sp. ZSWI3]|nr:N-formylglutamate amidohydrolase [Nitratireductor sp. ZSWI3]MCR4266192.1 N-formylglutamate amidohydrolase [Nitratireductor sp. ZSWI3]
MAKALLEPSEGSPVAIERREGRSPVVLVCEHASRTIPLALGTLGAEPETLDSHAAWDIGALAVARGLSERLDAPLVFQRFSRLVYDCNRPPEAPDAIPETSEIHRVPGNRNLDAAMRQQRADALYHPFHAAIGALIETRLAAGSRPVLVTVHSFTPVYFGKMREGGLGILHDADRELGDAMLAAAEEIGLAGVRRNYPYGPADGVTHTLKRHGLARGIPNVMLEIRNDLISGPQGQAEWADRVAGLLARALPLFEKEDAGMPQKEPKA